MGDWSNDPEAQEWVEHVLNELVPALQASSVTVSLVPDGPADVKFAVELGMSLMMDKPIILAVTPGQQVPAKLLAVADAVVEFDPNNPENRARIGDAITAAMRRIGSRLDGAQ